jgi:hypothetical protein
MKLTKGMGEVYHLSEMFQVMIKMNKSGVSKDHRVGLEIN